MPPKRTDPQTRRRPRGKWFVYILLCQNDRLYTGITTDVKRRFKEHQNKSAHFTSYNAPIRVVYTEKAASRSSALKREAAIKRLKKAQKLALINR